MSKICLILLLICSNVPLGASSTKISSSSLPDVSQRDIALLKASLDENDELFRKLLSEGATNKAKDTTGSSVLGIATRKGKVEWVELLIEVGASVDELNNEGFTLLHIAAREGSPAHYKLIKLFLSKGVNKDARDSYGDTPMHYAANYWNTDCLRLLIEAHADHSIANNKRQTPLHNACWNGHDAGVLLLLQNGANIHAVNEDGRNPLMDAACNSRTQSIEYLVAFGTDVTARSQTGRTALDYALTNDEMESDFRTQECVRTLRKLNASSSHVEKVYAKSSSNFEQTDDASQDSSCLIQ